MLPGAAQQMPTNTNDGLTYGFYPVEKLIVEIKSTRSPPKASITILLTVNPGAADVKELIIYAPPGFDFPLDCGENCVPGFTRGLDRLMKIVLRIGGGPLRSLGGGPSGGPPRCICGFIL